MTFDVEIENNSTFPVTELQYACVVRFTQKYSKSLGPANEIVLEDTIVHTQYPIKTGEQRSTALSHCWRSFSWGCCYLYCIACIGLIAQHVLALIALTCSHMY